MIAEVVDFPQLIDSIIGYLNSNSANQGLKEMI